MEALLDRSMPVVPAMAVALYLGAVLLTTGPAVRAGRLGGDRSLLMVAWLGLGLLVFVVDRHRPRPGALSLLAGLLLAASRPDTTSTAVQLPNAQEEATA